MAALENCWFGLAVSGAGARVGLEAVCAVRAVESSREHVAANSGRRARWTGKIMSASLSLGRGCGTGACGGIVGEGEVVVGGVEGGPDRIGEGVVA